MCLGSYQEVPAKSASVEAALRQILSQAELLLPKMEDVRAEMMGDLVDEEMQQTAKAIEEAAAKIAVCCLIAARWSQFVMIYGTLNHLKKMIKFGVNIKLNTWLC